MDVLYVAEVAAGPGDVAHGGDHVVLQLPEHQLLAQSHLHWTFTWSDIESDTVSAIVLNTVANTVSDIASNTVSDTVSEIVLDNFFDTVSDILFDAVVIH